MRTTIQTLRRKSISLLQSNPGLAIFASIAFGVFLSGCLLFSFTYLLQSTQVAIAEENTTLENTPVKVSTHKPVLGVNIANTGLVYIQGAKVLSVSGNMLVIQTMWDKAQLEWTILTNESYYETRHFGTNFFDSKGKNISIMDIKVGDIVSVSGDLDKNAQGLTIKADAIRRSY